MYEQSNIDTRIDAIWRRRLKLAGARMIIGAAETRSARRKRRQGQAQATSNAAFAMYGFVLARDAIWIAGSVFARRTWRQWRRRDTVALRPIAISIERRQLYRPAEARIVAMFVSRHD